MRFSPMQEKKVSKRYNWMFGNLRVFRQAADASLTENERRRSDEKRKRLMAAVAQIGTEFCPKGKHQGSQKVPEKTKS